MLEVYMNKMTLKEEVMNDGKFGVQESTRQRWGITCEMLKLRQKTVVAYYMCVNLEGGERKV